MGEIPKGWRSEAVCVSGCIGSLGSSGVRRAAIAGLAEFCILMHPQRSACVTWNAGRDATVPIYVKAGSLPRASCLVKGYSRNLCPPPKPRVVDGKETGPLVEREVRVQPWVRSYTGLSPSGQQSLGAPGRDVISHPRRLASTSVAARCEPRTSLRQEFPQRGSCWRCMHSPRLQTPGGSNLPSI